MPRQAAVFADEIVEVLSRLDIFDESDKLKPRADPIWNTACRELSNRVKPPALYISILQNRHNMCTRIREIQGLSVAPLQTNESLESDLNPNDDSGLLERSATDGIKECPNLFFHIILKNEVWHRIAPTDAIYQEKSAYGRNRRYSVLKPGWTDEVMKACWDVCKIPCAFTFKRAKVYDTGSGLYLTLHGDCKECGASLYGHCPKKPDPDSHVKIFIKTTDTRGLPHVKKRELRGREREIVGEQLLSTKASAWRRGASKTMNYGDPEPANLYSGDVLRKTRQEAKDKELGLYKAQDWVKSVQNMKYNVEFVGTIREIALDKFYCMYWSPTQLDLYKDAARKRFGPLTIDATGSVIKKIPRPNNESSGAIFLYQATLPGMSGIFPVFQMISEKHDTNMIAYWLREWLRSGAPIPLEVVTDFSLALLNGVSLAFTGKNLQDYVSACYASLEKDNGHETAETLRCLIRVDIAHLIKLVARWKCFQGKHGRVKDFYLRCIALMTTCSSKETFEEILLSVLVVALSECDGTDDSGSVTDCQRHQTLLLSKIKSFTSNLDYGEDQYMDEILSENQDLARGDIVSTINTIRCTAQRMTDEAPSSQRMNPYHLPQLVGSLVRLSRSFPLWTNVMLGVFGSSKNVASSARSEAYFNILKHSILDDGARPLRLDKFLVKHVRSIMSDCKMQRAAFDLRTNEPIRTCDSSPRSDAQLPSLDECMETPSDDGGTVSTPFLAEEENWRGQNVIIPINEEINTEVEIKKKIKQENVNFLDGSKDMKIYVDSEAIEDDITPKRFKGQRCKVEKNREKAAEASKQQNSSKKRGKYMQPCPDIHLIQSRPLRRRKNAIIQNGSMLPPVKIGSAKVHLLNTCPFDATAEILSTAYSDCATYKTAVDANVARIIFLKIVTEYAINGPSSRLYYERASLLTTIFSTSEGTINCASNIRGVIDRLFSEFPSVTETSVCKNCVVTTTRKLPVLDVNARPIMKEGLRAGLQQAISASIAARTVFCQRCNSRSLRLTKKAGVHLFVDVEHVYDPQLRRASGENSVDKTLSFDDVPATINIGVEIYTLHGIVMFKPPKIQNGIGHYSAVCRRVTGAWEEHDSVKQRLRVLEGTTARKIEEQMSLMIFVKQ